MRRFVALVSLSIAASLSHVERGHAEPTARFDLNLISDVQAGIFCYRSPDYVTKDRVTIDGKVDRFDEAPDIVKQTQIIPAIDGLLFGVSGRGSSSSGVVVTLEIEHPPLGASGITRETWEAWYPNDRITMNGYTLGLDRGDPAGKWTLTAKQREKVVFQVEFDVVEASKADNSLLAGCKN
jgi:Domain of unknown function (DUF3859)